MTARHLERKGLYRDEIKSTMLDMIFSGELKPGERIVETRWAKRFGVSQSPVREAIRELEMLDVIHTVPYKGSFIKKITPREIRDAYVVREMLEAKAISEVVHSIGGEQITHILDMLSRMREAAGQDDHRAYVYYDSLFHAGFVELSGNNILRRFWSQCSIHSFTEIGTSMSGQGLLTLADRHIGIYEALLAHDEERAVQAVCVHFALLIEDIDAVHHD